MSEAHDLSPGLLRQRRNLTLTSSTLLFLSYAQAEISSFQVLGISATFGRPEAVVVSLTLMTVYFFYRYWLYLVQEPGSGFKGEFYRRLNRYSKPKIEELRDSKFPEGEGLEIYEELGVRRQGWGWVMMVGSANIGGGAHQSSDLEVPFWKVWSESIKAFCLSIITRSYFTDYVFPILLAILALFVASSENWF